MYVHEGDWDLSSISGDECENPVYISTSEADTDSSNEEVNAGVSIMDEVRIDSINNLYTSAWPSCHLNYFWSI